MSRSWVCGIVCFVLAIGSLTVAPAQPPAGGAEKPKAGGPPKAGRGKLLGFLRQNPELRLPLNLKPALAAALGFTDEQITQFNQASEAANPQAAEEAFKQKMRDPNLTKEDRKKLQVERETQMKAMREALQKKLDEIMTPDQKALIQKIAEANKAAEKAMREALEQSLDQALTPEQKERMAHAEQRHKGEPRPPKPQ